ncbi:MAG TPA: aminotransferase class III-fold pyridoxal phosphate-dependent enzyme [Planctomycetaceae bacterium]|nr:aminotransferase class III-fold pyridoxal phosphate-dependent enzyme [Planctomycetaceae bacterium]
MSSDEIARWYERGRAVLPGGVCSSTRFNQALGGPIYASRAKGARFWDLADREYLDMSMSHGAALLGHAPDALEQAFLLAWKMGVVGSLDTPYHVQLAEQLCELVPCAERVRFTNSGTEATLHALRLCRAATGRERILRFSGHFHGYHDFTLIGGHPPAAQIDAIPPYRESPGIPAALADLVVQLEYNNFEQLEAAVLREKDRAGTILIEPVDYNCGCITPAPGFLERARTLADHHGMLLFFDEIQSFAKKSPGGAQHDFGVKPDLCTIGKSLGAGLPLSAIAGRADLLDRFKPTGPVAHSGTFNAPLLNMLAGLVFVNEIKRPEFWRHIEALGARLYAGLDEIAADSRVPVLFQHHGSRFGITFGTREPVTNYRQSLVHSPALMLEFCRQAAERGVYFHDYGGQSCHHGYSSAHTAADIDRVLNVVRDSLAAMARS